MMKGRLRRALREVQLVAAIISTAGCSGGGALESPAQRAADSGSALPAQAIMAPYAFTGMEPSTMVELQHFDAYEYYRGVFDPPLTGARPVAGSLHGDSIGQDFLSCFRSRAFK